MKAPSYKPCSCGADCNFIAAGAEEPCWGQVAMIEEGGDGSEIHACQGHREICDWAHNPELGRKYVPEDPTAGCDYVAGSNEPCDSCPRRITCLYRCKLLLEASAEEPKPLLPDLQPSKRSELPAAAEAEALSPVAGSPVPGKIRLECWVDGDRYGFNCPKGLWSVEGSELGEVIEQALRYYRQYEAAGEYLPWSVDEEAPAGADSDPKKGAAGGLSRSPCPRS